LQISYSDTSGSRQIVQKEISLDVSSSQISGTAVSTTRSRGIDYFTIILIVIVVVVVFLLWYFKFRKNKTFLSLLGKIKFKK
jgi:cobalamin biosynthesis Mg chelatase CobN